MLRVHTKAFLTVSRFKITFSNGLIGFKNTTFSLNGDLTKALIFRKIKKASSLYELLAKITLQPVI